MKTEPEFKIGDTITLECIDSDKGLYKLKQAILSQSF